MKQLEFNHVIRTIINNIMDEILDKTDDEDIIDWVSSEWQPYLNYSDSHLNIESLDNIENPDDEYKSNEKLIEAVLKEIKEKSEGKSGK